MKKYREITMSIADPSRQEELIALLSDAGFEGFEQNENSLVGYILESEDATDYKIIFENLKIDFIEKDIEEKNWNELWESNFDPIIIDDFVSVRAHFHPPAQSVAHEIVITPKMSFGTGHHATTEMMIRQIRNLDFVNKKVFDFGTGTGILAILAEKLGANDILATDIDEWSIRNAKENVIGNNCKQISVLQSAVIPSSTFNIILANINKHVILDQLVDLKKALDPEGTLILSGFLVTDETDLLNAAELIALNYVNRMNIGNWLSLTFRRKDAQ